MLYLAPSSSVRLFSKCIYKVCAKLLAKPKEMAVSKASIAQPRPAPLFGKGSFKLLQCASIVSCKSSCPLSGVKRCPIFEGSVCIS